MKEMQMNEFDLMTKILNIRYVDLNEEKTLCHQLLNLAQKRQNTYARTFAYVYLFDALLALGEYDLCNDYLSQAFSLGRKYNYKELLLTLCNLAGLYFIRLNDEPKAFQYFLDGIHLADNLEDKKTRGMIYNNMGLGFAGRGDWKSAKQMFMKACASVEHYNNKEYEQRIISYLSNLAESCLQIGEMDEAKNALLECDAFENKGLYYQIRIGCEWTSYYAKHKQKEKCLEQAKHLIELKIDEFNNKYFICDMIENICVGMLSIQEYDWAKQFVNMLDRVVKDAPPIIRYRAQCAKIVYLEAIDGDTKDAYKEYYEIDQEMAVVENGLRLQSILSIIQLHEVLKELDEIQFEKEVLESAIQLDELTGLYSRRYFNKLTTKIRDPKLSKSLGIVMIDIDYFKQYNDLYGHLKGDEVLREVGALLKKYASIGISPSRYGGDEFVCFCYNVSSEDMDAYVLNIYKGMKQLHVLHEGAPNTTYVTLSIGYVHYQGNDEIKIDTLLSLADQALYKVKEKGRNHFYREDVS